MLHRAPRTVAVLLGLAGLVLVPFVAPASAAGGSSVVVLPATGVVDGTLAGYLSDGVAAAAADGARAVVVKLNTPGGSLDATQQITTAFLEAKVPVIVWVAPAGGRAASAGTFIAMAANLVFMAPGTNIGAASPIDSSGADIPGTLGVKVLNDAIANISSIAEARGRPVAWAVSTVANASSYAASDAIAAGAADGMAGTIEDVLAAANGRTVTVAGAQVVLDLAGATVTERGMNPLQGLLHLVTDPNIAFVLFVLGVLGIGFEFMASNFLTGILGAMSIVLAFVGFGSLPLNLAGLVLVTIGIVMIILEAHIPSHGALTVAAGICVALGAGMLYAAPGGPTMPDASVAFPVILVVVGMMGAFGLLVAVTAVRTRRLARSPHLVGSLRVVGEPGKVGRPIDPLGSVLAAGEEWSARAVDGRRLERGALVRVVRKDGLILFVEPLFETAAPGTQPVEPAPLAPLA